jgi:hypothetical protein
MKTTRKYKLNTSGLTETLVPIVHKFIYAAEVPFMHEPYIWAVVDDTTTPHPVGLYVTRDGEEPPRHYQYLASYSSVDTLIRHVWGNML